MPKQLDSISSLIIRLKRGEMELESISCTGIANDGAGYVKSVSDFAGIKELSAEEQDAALLLVKMAKNRIEQREALSAKPDPIIEGVIK